MRRQEEQLQAQMRQRQAEEEARRQEEEQRRQQAEREAEKEKLRCEALPLSLCQAARMDREEARRPDLLKRFLPLYTAETRDLMPHCPDNVAEDKWVLNFQVALLVGTKDLQLSQFAGQWQKHTPTLLQKHCVWRVSRTLLTKDLESLRWSFSIDQMRELLVETNKKFFAMASDQVFWLKVGFYNLCECALQADNHIAFRLPIDPPTISSSTRHQAHYSTYLHPGGIFSSTRMRRTWLLLPPSRQNTSTSCSAFQQGSTC